MLTSIWKDIKKVWSLLGFEAATSGFWTAVTPDTHILQDTNTADLNSARHVQFQEKEENINRTGYCGYTANFLSVSLSCIWQSPTPHSFAFLTSLAHVCFASRLIFDRFRLAFFQEKSQKIFAVPVFLHYIKSLPGLSINAWKDVYESLQLCELRIEETKLLLFFYVVSETKKPSL